MAPKGREKLWDQLPTPVHEYDQGSPYLRYSSLAHDRIPTSYMHVDEAIDEIGKRKFPGFWGLQPNFHKLPFDRTFRRPDLKFDDNGRWKLVVRKIVGLNLGEPGLSTLHKQFAFSAYRLIRGLETGDLQLHPISSTMGVMPAINIGVATKQQSLITYFGRVCPPGAKRTAMPLTAVLERRLFDAWVVLPEADENPVLSRIPSSHRVNVVCAAIVSCLQSVRAKSTNERLWALVNSQMKSAQFDFARHNYEKNIWQKIPLELKIRNKPSKADLEDWSGTEASLAAAILHAISP